MSINPLSAIAQGVPSTVRTPGTSPLVGRSPVDALPVERDFAAVLGREVSALANQLRQAEAVSIAGIKGTAPTQEVVAQIMSAEQALQTSIAVRDKIVAAYLEISRMAI